MSAQIPQKFGSMPRRLRLGMVGGGAGLIGEVHANGARLSNRWELVAGALSSHAERAKAAGKAWFWRQIAVMKATKRWRVQKRNAQMALMLWRS